MNFGPSHSEITEQIFFYIHYCFRESVSEVIRPCVYLTLCYLYMLVG